MYNYVSKDFTTVRPGYHPLEQQVADNIKNYMKETDDYHPWKNGDLVQRTFDKLCANIDHKDWHYLWASLIEAIGFAIEEIGQHVETSVYGSSRRPHHQIDPEQISNKDLEAMIKNVAPQFYKVIQKKLLLRSAAGKRVNTKKP